MYSKRDIEYRTIMVLNCIEPRELHVQQGLFELVDKETNKKLTKIPFQKLLAIFVIGSASITTPLIDKCKYYNVALVIMRTNLRPVFYWSKSMEGNFLLHKKQYEHQKSDIRIAKQIVYNKINNQLKLLERVRKKSELRTLAIEECKKKLQEVERVIRYEHLMGLEGYVSKNFFKAYFNEYNWNRRAPRVRFDYLNSLLDIGYSILFNYIECYTRIFGFDPYIGIYHCLWYQRKSLVCDLVEPFRCIIEHIIRNGISKKRFQEKHFENRNGEYLLKKEYRMEYYKIFYTALIKYKQEIFIYVQSYYRAFMNDKEIPMFNQFD